MLGNIGESNNSNSGRASLATQSSVMETISEARVSPSQGTHSDVPLFVASLEIINTPRVDSGNIILEDVAKRARIHTPRCPSLGQSSVNTGGKYGK